MPLHLPTSHPAFKGKIQGTRGPTAGAPKTHNMSKLSDVSMEIHDTRNKIPLQHRQKSKEVTED